MPIRLRWASLGIVLLCLVAWPAPSRAASAPIISARVFAGTPAPDDDTVAPSNLPWSFPYTVDAVVHGVSGCDSWTIEVDGPGGGTYRFAGGTSETIALSGAIAPGDTADLTADVTCTIAGVATDATSPDTFVTEAAPADTSLPAPADTSSQLSRAATNALRQIARNEAELAVLACAPAKLTTAHRPPAVILSDLCRMAIWQAVSASGAASDRSDAPDSDGVTPLVDDEPATEIEPPLATAVCGSLRGKRCDRAVAVVGRAIEDERADAAILDALDRARSGDYPGAASSIAAAYYSARLAALLRVDRSARKAIAAYLRGRHTDIRLRPSRAGTASLPATVLHHFPKAMITALALDKPGHELAEDYWPEASSALPVGRLPSLTLTGLLRVALPRAPFAKQSDLGLRWNVLEDAADNEYPVTTAGRTVFAAHLQWSAISCDLGFRAREAQSALHTFSTDKAPADFLLRWLATRVTVTPETKAPAGCPAPPSPAPGGPFASIGSWGSGPGQFDDPSDIAVGPGGIYVADYHNGRIERFGLNGTYIGSFGAGQLLSPTNLALDASGNVYVSDFLNDTVDKFTGDGQLISQWGGSGSGDGQLDRPTGIVVGPNGLVYVADAQNQRVEVFSAAGTFQSAFPSADAPSDALLDTGLRGITVDGQGNVYLADRDAGSVKEYGPDGTFIRDFGERGTDPGTFNGLYDIAVAPDGTLWLADLDNYWLQHFTAGGQYLGKLDSWGPNGESFNPWAVAIYGGNLYAVDINGGTGDRVLVWGGLIGD